MSGRSLTAAAMRKSSSLQEPDALTTREVDGLVSKLLTDVKIPFPSLGKRVLGHLADLKKVLSTDYVESAKFPSKDLLKDLSRRVDTDIKKPMTEWQPSMAKPWEDPSYLEHLTK